MQLWREMTPEPAWLETLQLIMFVFEQLGLMNYDIPDRVTLDHELVTAT